MERDRGEAAPYWQFDEQIGEVALYRDRWTLRLALHTSDELYRRSAHVELVPLTAERGTKTYVHARPYILVPDITLDLRLYPQSDPVGAIGEVASSAWEGMKAEYVGNAQAWFYHEDGVIVLWEAFFDERFRRGEATTDPNLPVLWQGFERALLARFPAARQLVTTASDPVYETTTYHQFLIGLGYRRLNQATFGKQL